MTLPATDGIMEKLQALLSYDASSPLIFSSGLFLFLFAGFLLVYSAFRRAPMARIVYVIAFSLYFYYKSSGIYFLLLIFAATSDFLIAQGIYRVRSRAAKRWLVVLSVMVNLGMLGYFKYTNFLVDIANQMFGQGFLQFQNIFLPVGISFFVFQSMSYTIDIYRGQLKPLSNWLDYLFYLSFFPQLVAGPIVRYADIEHEIDHRRATLEGFAQGLRLFCVGLGKKVLLANTAGVLADSLLPREAAEIGFIGCFSGVAAYTFQIYFDFSGYSDMAIGLGKMMGFEYPRNFNYPYTSKSATEFWRRWHISLSSWFRDYVYSPLGGSKKGEGRTYLNLLVVWLFTGLWHGSTLNFLLWGLFLFALISLERLGWGKVLRRSQVISRLYMLLVIPLSWMLFAIPSLKDIGSYIGRLFAFSGGTAVHARDFLVYGRQYAVVLVIGLLVSTPLPEKLWRRIRTSPLGTVLLLVLFWVCVYCMAVATNDPFMYFSF